MKSRFALVIQTTAVVSTITTIFLGLVYAVTPQPWLFSLCITMGTIAYHFLMRLLVGAIVPACIHLPSDHSWFRPRKWEQPLYRFLRVKHWKRNLPTYDPSQFSLEENTLRQVIDNMCNAELVHEGIILFSFLPLAFSIPFGDFPVFLITSILAAAFDGIFVIAQRYNRPRLQRILSKKEAFGP